MYLSLPSTWDEYLAQLPAPSRRRLQTALRAFDAWTGGHARLVVARTHAELEEGTRVLRELAQAEVTPELLTRDALELMWLCAHGQPVAALCNLVSDDAVQLHRIGWRTDVPDGVRPDLVIHALAVRRAIELGRRGYRLSAGG